MTTDSQKRSLKQWHKALLRLTLPIVLLLSFACTAGTIVFLGPLCGIAASICWVISGDAHSEYTVSWCVLPMALGFIYIDWLKEKDVIKP